jgi:RNA polymerase sigma factor (sigma-70 family)
VVPARPNWETVYRNAVPRVYRALLATLRDARLAEDALHEAFAEGLRRPPPSDENLAGWLFRVALRRARRRPWRFASLIGQEKRAARDDLEGVLDRLEAGRLLGLLTERQRAVVVAHYYLGLTQAETATLFGLRPGTVSATIAQALTRMRKGAIHA